MKVYRGPESKDFFDGSHELVDTRDLSKETGSWTSQKLIKVNISKESYERQSVAHINIEERDVIALHQGLLSGLHEKARKSDTLNEEVKVLRAALEKIKNKTFFTEGKQEEVFKEIRTLATSALKESKK